MSITLHWFLPTHGDGRSIVDRPGQSPVDTGIPREPDIDYLAQVAAAAERVGFTGMLTPTGSWCQDAWLTTAALLARTKTIKFLVAFRPGALSPSKARTSSRLSSRPSMTIRASEPGTRHGCASARD